MALEMQAAQEEKILMQANEAKYESFYCALEAV